MHATITDQQLTRALALRDLSDPAGGAHAMQLLVDAITAAVEAAWGVPVTVHRAHALVTAHENYELLGYAPDAAAR
ncbi:MAG: hypothetical protein ACTHNU_07005, partial [Gaiellales bacterium]